MARARAHGLGLHPRPALASLPWPGTPNWRRPRGPGPRRPRPPAAGHRPWSMKDVERGGDPDS
eukprot:8858515-Alexandrium_andersonii.AAC.1